MKNVATIEAVRDAVTTWRRKGERIAFVPTMGNLHDGHLHLVKEAQGVAQRVVVSIFVNPLQFNDQSDFSRYPRTLDADQQKLVEAGADVLFTPASEEIYPEGFVTSVYVPRLSEILCGAYRPGHFVGMTTVVNKLFNIVQPDVALFGLKDFQQFIIVQRMVRDLALPIELLGVETVRESDGLALSSRNCHLTFDERPYAPVLYQVLSAARDQLSSGTASIAVVEHRAMNDLEQTGFKLEYFSVRSAADLQAPTDAQREVVILAAAWLGKTRLIDNIVVVRPD